LSPDEVAEARQRGAREETERRDATERLAARLAATHLGATVAFAEPPATSAREGGGVRVRVRTVGLPRGVVRCTEGPSLVAERIAAASTVPGPQPAAQRDSQYRTYGVSVPPSVAAAAAPEQPTPPPAGGVRQWLVVEQRGGTADFLRKLQTLSVPHATCPYNALALMAAANGGRYAVAVLHEAHLREHSAQLAVDAAAAAALVVVLTATPATDPPALRAAYGFAVAAACLPAHASLAAVHRCVVDVTAALPLRTAASGDVSRYPPLYGRLVPPRPAPTLTFQSAAGARPAAEPLPPLLGEMQAAKNAAAAASSMAFDNASSAAGQERPGERKRWLDLLRRLRDELARAGSPPAALEPVWQVTGGGALMHPHTSLTVLCVYLWFGACRSYARCPRTTRPGPACP
jgi:hypothetical protein